MSLRKLLHAFFQLYKPKSNNLYIAPWLAYGLGVGGAKIFGGLLQRRKANQLKQSNFIPPALREAQTEADTLANATTAPGQQAEEEMVKQGTSQFLSNVSKTAGSANELINFAGAAQGNQNKAVRDIARRTLLWKDNQRANRNAIRGKVANQQVENRRQLQAAKSSLFGASNENIFGGLSDIGGNLAFAATERNENKNANMPKFIWGLNGKLGIPNAQ